MLNTKSIKTEELQIVRGNSINATFDITLNSNVNPLVEFGIRYNLTSPDLLYASTNNNKIILLDTVIYKDIFNKKYKLNVSAEDTNTLLITDFNNDGNNCNDKYLLGYMQVSYGIIKELLLELKVYIKEGYYEYT